MTTVREELSKVAGIEQKEGETWSKFANRLVRTIDKKDIPDTEWSQVSPESQSWYNTAVEKISNGQSNAIPAFAGETVPEEEKGSKTSKAKKEKTTGAGSGRPKRMQEDQKITLLVDKNPKRPGSNAASVFDLYKNGMTVKQALDAGIPRGHMNWDLDHGFIKVE